MTEQVLRAAGVLRNTPAFWAWVFNVTALIVGTYVAVQMHSMLIIWVQALTVGILLGMTIGRKRGHER